MTDNHLLNQLDTARKLTDIAVILVNVSRPELLPTVLELLLIEIQNIVESHCIEEDSGKQHS